MGFILSATLNSKSTILFVCLGVLIESSLLSNAFAQCARNADLPYCGEVKVGTKTADSCEFDGSYKIRGVEQNISHLTIFGRDKMRICSGDNSLQVGELTHWCDDENGRGGYYLRLVDMKDCPIKDTPVWKCPNKSTEEKKANADLIFLARVEKEEIGKKDGNGYPYELMVRKSFKGNLPSSKKVQVHILVHNDCNLRTLTRGKEYLVFATRKDKDIVVSYSDTAEKSDAKRDLFNLTTPVTREECVKEGGYWGTFGLMVTQECNRKTSDAGVNCMSSWDCEGYCIADISEDDRTLLEKEPGKHPLQRSGKCSSMNIGRGRCDPILKEGGVVDAVSCSD